MNSNYHTALMRLLSHTTNPKLGLDLMRTLMHALDNPQQKFKSIHIAGTNGKGSTVAFTESILRHAGFKTGATISPHLSCARERIRINQEMISEDFFCELEQQVHNAAEQCKIQPTFFERITAMAFLAFAKQDVDYAIVEVGLGGRLDATNILEPVVCGITHIDMDHMDFLGSNLESIAQEKAGIMKTGVPYVAAPQVPEITKVLSTHSQKIGSKLLPRPTQWGEGLSNFHQFPHYQQENITLSMYIVDALNLKIDPDLMLKGIESTNWPGRYELISTDPLTLLDGAHNSNGIDTLLRSLSLDSQLATKKKVFVIGFTQGHELNSMVKLLAKTPNTLGFIITQARSPRAVEPLEIERNFRLAGVPIVIRANPILAFKEAKRLVKDNTVIIVTGSLYIVGEIRAMLCNSPYDIALPRY